MIAGRTSRPKKRGLNFFYVLHLPKMESPSQYSSGPQVSQSVGGGGGTWSTSLSFGLGLGFRGTASIFGSSSTGTSWKNSRNRLLVRHSSGSSFATPRLFRFTIRFEYLKLFPRKTPVFIARHLGDVCGEVMRGDNNSNS